MRSANERIKAAKRDNEREVLKLVRRFNVWRPVMGCNSLAMLNALDRLTLAGRVKYDVREHGYVLCRGN